MYRLITLLSAFARVLPVAAAAASEVEADDIDLVCNDPYTNGTATAFARSQPDCDRVGWFNGRFWATPSAEQAMWLAQRPVPDARTRSQAYYRLPLN